MPRWTCQGRAIRPPCRPRSRVSSSTQAHSSPPAAVSCKTTSVLGPPSCTLPMRVPRAWLPHATAPLASQQRHVRVRAARTKTETRPQQTRLVVIEIEDDLDRMARGRGREGGGVRWGGVGAGGCHGPVPEIGSGLRWCRVLWWWSDTWPGAFGRSL